MQTKKNRFIKTQDNPHPNPLPEGEGGQPVRINELNCRVKEHGFRAYNYHEKLFF